MDKWGGGELLRRAVRGMLPKNRLRDVRLRRLRAFEGIEHPFKENLVQFHGQEVKSILDVLPKEKKKQLTEEIVI